MAGAVAGRVGHVPKPGPSGGHWVAVPQGALAASVRPGRDAERERGREKEREVSGGPGIPWAGRPRSVDTAAVAAEKVLFIPSQRSDDDFGWFCFPPTA